MGFIKELVGKVNEDDVLGLSAEMSYRFLLALFPLFIFIAALGGFVANLIGIENPTQEVRDMVSDALPSDAASIVSEEMGSVLNSQSGGLLSFGVIAAIWAASGAVKTIMKATNRAYDVEEARPFWRKYLVAIGLTLLTGLFVIAAFVLLIGGQVAGEAVAGAVGLEGAFATVVNIARWPIVILLLMLAVAVLYRWAPHAQLPFQWLSPGAVFFILGWLIATVAFGFYVANFGSYNATYGALGGVIILLLWFYITSFVLLLGAEINALIYERKHVPEEERARRRERSAAPSGVPAHGD